MAPLYWIGLTIMRSGQHTSRRPSHVGERLFMALGLVVSVSDLLSLLACGMGWSAVPDFFWLWLCLSIGCYPLGPVLDLCLRHLFWI